MFAQFRASWRHLIHAPPGRRFQEYHSYHLVSRRARWIALCSLVLGLLLVTLGLIALVTPGPGVLMVVVGAGLLARESLLAARGMDWLELRIRGAFEQGGRLWRGASGQLRVAAGLLGLLLLGAVLYGSFSLILGV